MNNSNFEIIKNYIDNYFPVDRDYKISIQYNGYCHFIIVSYKEINTFSLEEIIDLEEKFKIIFNNNIDDRYYENIKLFLVFSYEYENINVEKEKKEIEYNHGDSEST